MLHLDQAQEENEFYEELNFFVDINKDNIFGSEAVWLFTFRQRSMNIQ